MFRRSNVKVLIVFLAGAALGWLLSTVPKGGVSGDGHGAERLEEQSQPSGRRVRLDKTQLEQFGVKLATAGPGNINRYLDLPGEVVIDPDRLARILPRVPGVAVKVMKTIGDRVEQGEILAVLESRELSDLKSAYLVAGKRLELADKTFKREETLWKEKISSEREYLAAKRGQEEAAIELHSARQKLAALGFSPGELAGLSFDQGTPLTAYRMTAPFEGTVINKYISLGESLSGESVAFTIADLKSVWVNLTVYQKDLHLVRSGQPVEIVTGDSSLSDAVLIDYVGPEIGEQTRTGYARAVLDNRSGLWKPGMFVNARVLVSAQAAQVAIPPAAIFEFEGRECVFVQTEAGFEPRPLVTGQRNGKQVEVLSGVNPGEIYVAEGAFTLKAELIKADFAGEIHGHE